MSRVLMATEGPVDEVVLSALCVAWGVSRASDLSVKRFPARGIEQVLRLAPDLIRAAHFGYHDVLIIHVDVDDSPAHREGHAEPRCRRCLLAAQVMATLEAVGSREGMSPLSAVLALPRQTTDAWLLWGRDDGDADAVERLSRHEVKRRVFGETRAGHVDRARQLVPALLGRLRAVESPPPALAMFHKELMASCGGAAPPGPA